MQKRTQRSAQTELQTTYEDPCLKAHRLSRNQSQYYASYPSRQFYTDGGSYVIDKENPVRKHLSVHEGLPVCTPSTAPVPVLSTTIPATSVNIMITRTADSTFLGVYDTDMYLKQKVSDNVFITYTVGFVDRCFLTGFSLSITYDPPSV
mgnify:CR=1 FL=1